MQPLQCYSITGWHGGSLFVSVSSLRDTTEGWSSKSEGQAVHAPTTVWSQATSWWQCACLMEEHCISCRMLLHAQQLQTTVRVDWSSVKCTQLAVHSLVSWNVAILVPVGIDLCRKRECDLTHDHFQHKSIHCEGLSVYHHWCEADSPLSNLCTWPCDHCSRICSSRIGLYTHQPTHWWQGRSVRHLRRCSPCVCVCVCVCVCICVWICWYTWIMSHYVSERPKTVLWLTSKFAIMSSLNVPLHLKCIATLPCEMYNCFAYCNMTCCM